MSNLERRVEKLEGVDGGFDAVVWVESHETAAEAVNRYRGEHPEIGGNANILTIGWEG